MKYTEVKDNKRVAKENSFLFEQFKDALYPMSALSLLLEELSFFGDTLGRKRVFSHDQIPHLLIKIDLKKDLLNIFHKDKKKDTIIGFTTTEQLGNTDPNSVYWRYTKYKINDNNVFNYEETFNFIINQIRTLWESK
jgi:hypothetical protein